MCQCIECAGYIPEPYNYKDPITGDCAIYYLSDRLTTFHNSEIEAWEEFDKVFIKYWPEY